MLDKLSFFLCVPFVSSVVKGLKSAVGLLFRSHSSAYSFPPCFQDLLFSVPPW